MSYHCKQDFGLTQGLVCQNRFQTCATQSLAWAIHSKIHVKSCLYWTPATVQMKMLSTLYVPLRSWALPNITIINM